MTLSDLVIMHDSYLLDRWDHTAMIAMNLQTIACVTINAYSKKGASPMKPARFEQLHPYRKTGPKEGSMKLTPKNFHVVKTIVENTAKQNG